MRRCSRGDAGDHRGISSEVDVEAEHEIGVRVLDELAARVVAALAHVADWIEDQDEGVTRLGAEGVLVGLADVDLLGGSFGLCRRFAGRARAQWEQSDGAEGH